MSGTGNFTLGDAFMLIVATIYSALYYWFALRKK